MQPQFNGPVKDDPSSKNVTMREISSTGPFYASLITGGTLDTKGGPKANTHGQVR